MIIYGIFLGILSRMAWEDGRQNVIRSSTLWIYSMVGIVTAAIRQIWMQEPLPWMDMTVLAGLLCFLRKVMPQGMGEGDIWALMVLPMYVAAAQMWEGILYSMFLMIPIAAWQYWRKKDKTAEIPYLPFLWMGMMLAGRNMLYGVY
ncbi:MAG: prepilin peptidase [Lachnospirales bacterium]